MWTGGAGGNGDGVSRLRAEDLTRRRDQLREDQRRGRRGRRLEVVAGGGEGALQRCRERQTREARVQRLQATPVVLPRQGPWRQQAFGGAHHQPEREQPFPPRSPHRLGDQTDEALLGRRGGANHATSRSTAVATSPGVISVRQRWWPSGHVAVPVEEHGRQSSPRSSTTERA